MTRAKARCCPEPRRNLQRPHPPAAPVYAGGGHGGHKSRSAPAARALSRAPAEKYPRPAVARILSIGNMYPPHSEGGYELAWRSNVRWLRQRGFEVRVLASD